MKENGNCPSYLKYQEEWKVEIQMKNCSDSEAKLKHHNHSRRSDYSVTKKKELRADVFAEQRR
jgi:hypothetical protein